VKVTEWRPDSELEAIAPASLWGGVARKPLYPPRRSQGFRPT
jgi:hypothetical protein